MERKGNGKVRGREGKGKRKRRRKGMLSEGEEEGIE